MSYQIEAVPLFDRVAISLSRWVVGLEPLLLAVAAPFLLFPFFFRALTVLALALLPGLWVSRWKARGHVTRPTIMDTPIFVLMALLPGSLWASTDWGTSLPKLTTILLGVAIFYAVVNHPTQGNLRPQLMTILTGLTAAVCLFGLMGTDWFSSKLLPLDTIYGHLPRWVSNVPGSIRAGGFHPNEVGGTLAMLVPITLASALALALPVASSPRTNAGSSRRDAEAWVTVGVLFIAAVTLVLTQSRAALIAMSVALVILITGSSRRWMSVAILPLLGIALLSASQLSTATSTASSGSAQQTPTTAFTTSGDLLVSLDRSTANRPGRSGSTWNVRLEIWHNAWESLWDYPFTGSGLATFTAVSKANYPYDEVDPRFPITHAHNLFLQVGADVGWFGLVAFLMMNVLFFVLAGRVYRRTSGRAARWYVRGLVAGMCGYLIFGLFDAVTVGSKPSLAYWLILGAMVAHASDLESDTIWPRRTRQMGMTLGLLAVLFAGFTLFGAGPARASRGALRLDRVLLSDDLPPADRERMTRDALADLRSGVTFPWAEAEKWRRIGQSYLLLGSEAQALEAWRHDDLAYPFLLWQGWSAEESGDLQRAARFYDLAIRLAPQRSRAAYRRGRILQAQGQTQAALDAYRQALEVDVFDGHAREQADAYRRRGQILAGQGDHAAARDAFQASVDLEPDEPTLLAVAWSAYLVDGDAWAAQQIFKQAVAMNRENPFLAIEAGRKWLNADQVELAQQWVRYLSEHFPAQLWAWYLQGQIDMAQDYFLSAEHSFRTVVSIAPDLAAGHWWLGQAYGAQKQWDLAIRETEQATALEPGNRLAWLALGDFYRLSGGHLEEAVQAYQAMLDSDPADREAFNRLTKAYQDAGDPAGARAALDRLLATTPGDAEAWNLRGQMAFDGGDYAAAVESFRRVVALDPSDAQAYYVLARALIETGDSQAAARVLDQVIALAPRSWEAWMLRGQIAMSQDDFAKAEQSLQQAISIHPDSATGHWWLGQAYGAQKQWEEAIRETQAATRLMPSYRFAWLALGDFYRLAGRSREDAIQAYRTMLALDPNDPIAQERLKQMGVE